MSTKFTHSLPLTSFCRCVFLVSQAELHDAAGAALIRALLKNGIEVDFVERCHRSLNWALGSIRRQRERELKEAEEEAKDEKRREQERVAMAEAATRREEYEADFVRFGEGVAKFLAEVEAGEATISAASIGPDGSVETDAEAQQIIFKAKQTFVANGPQGGNHEETLQLIKKLSPSDKTVDILLIEARCHEHNANYKAVISAAGKVIQKAATHEPWVNGTPRMMAATFGANAAMQLGLSTNALSFYQNVLKFDPEQDRARKQYRGLKKVVKLMDKAEEQIQKGYNKKASEIVEDCLVAMRGLDVDSPLFRTKIQLKQCAILSGMQKHEEALEYCDAALDVRLNDESVMAESRKEAHLVRAEALLLDMDYDEAVNDFRAAFDLVPEEKENLEDKRELQHKLQQAMHQQELWNGGKKDFQFNEKTGYPDGRPPQRDHAKILLLPIDLEEREKEIKCAWLKKQFKMLVKKYHPDKYKGNIKRGSRKFKEVKEAKEILSNAWGC
jgi:tetratricopeptide (TPR) repeat protein